MPFSSDELINRPETAVWVRKSVDTIRRMEKSETNPDGPFETVRVGRSVLIKAESVRSYLEAQ